MPMTNFDVVVFACV